MVAVVDRKVLQALRTAFDYVTAVFLLVLVMVGLGLLIYHLITRILG